MIKHTIPLLNSYNRGRTDNIYTEIDCGEGRYAIVETYDLLGVVAKDRNIEFHYCDILKQIVDLNGNLLTSLLLGDDRYEITFKNTDSLDYRWRNLVKHVPPPRTGTLEDFF